MGKYQDRSCAFVNHCLACGRELVGRGTKRFVANGYVCYGDYICNNPGKRQELIDEYHDKLQDKNAVWDLFK